MILYIIAMHDEAKDIIEKFQKIQETPFSLYQYNNQLLVISGIGKVNASLALSSVLTKYKVSQIINIGFAGANGNYQLGDKIMIESASYHDFDLTIFGYKKGQVPSYPAIFKSTLTLNCQYPKAHLYTGDYFMTEKLNNNYLVDMEGAALYQVAYKYNVPIISYKIVSDIIGVKNHKEEYENFEKNGSLYVKQIYDKINKEAK